MKPLKKLHLKEKSVIYLLDVGSRTGGGEAIFQLRVDLENMGYRAVILSRDKHVRDAELPEKFKKYVNGTEDFCFPQDVKDEPDNCIIVPEVATTFLFEYKNIQKAVWWLSSRYYDGKCRIKNRPDSFKSYLMHAYDYAGYLRHCVRRIKKYGKPRYPLSEVCNIAGYHHVEEILKNKYKVEPELLIHSIGVDFLNIGMYTEKTGREDIVLYNPKKPSKIVNQLLERKNFNFVPVKGLSVDQMIELFRKSKVYVDFGQFPGPERLPKETVYNGVNVLVGRKNTSNNYNDVMVPDEFKLSHRESIEEIERKIRLLIDDYEKYFPLYDDYRNMVRDMEKNYYSQMEQIFKKEC